MKPKKLQKKLNLNKSTVVSLALDDLHKVKGGETNVITLCLPLCTGGCSDVEVCTVSCFSCGTAHTCLC